MVATFGESFCVLEATLVEFGSIVRGDAVDYQKANTVPFYRHGNLVPQDVLLRLDIVNMRALYSAQRRFLVCWQ